MELEISRVFLVILGEEIISRSIYSLKVILDLVLLCSGNDGVMRLECWECSVSCVRECWDGWECCISCMRECLYSWECSVSVVGCSNNGVVWCSSVCVVSNLAVGVHGSGIFVLNDRSSLNFHMFNNRLSEDLNLNWDWFGTGFLTWTLY